MYKNILYVHIILQSEKEGNDQELIQLSTTPDLRYHMGK